MDWPQIGPKIAIKQGKKRQKDKWYLFRAPTPLPFHSRLSAASRGLALHLRPKVVGVRSEKSAPKRKFRGGYPCGHPGENFGQALQILEKKHFGTDIPRGRTPPP